MTTMNTEQLAERFTAALQQDIALLKDICAPDCRLWHSTDNKWMAQAPALDAFIAAQQAGQVPAFDGDVRITPTAKGFLAQTSITVEPLGKTHLTQIMTVENGLITVIEEYIAPEMEIPMQPAN